MSMSANLELVREVYGHYLAGDIDRVCAFMCEELDWQSVGPADLPWAGTLRGCDALREYLARSLAHVQVERFDVREYIAQGDRVVVLSELDVHFRATGQTETFDKVDVLRVRDGKIVSFREFYDTARALAALQPTETSGANGAVGASA